MSVLLAACIVIAVHDGDTLTARCKGRAHDLVLRVAEIDAPEFRAFQWGDQPGRIEARESATALCLKQEAKVRLWKYDGRTRRWIAYVECAGVDLSSYMVAHGLAWSYLPAKKSQIPALQTQAQLFGLGIWQAGSTPIPPSVWRKEGLH